MNKIPAFIFFVLAILALLFAASDTNRETSPRVNVAGKELIVFVAAENDFQRAVNLALGSMCGGALFLMAIVSFVSSEQDKAQLKRDEIAGQKKYDEWRERYGGK